VRGLTISRWTTVFSLVLILPLQAGAVDRPELTPLPLPDLSTMEDATRRRLEALQERVAELSTSGSDGALSEAYGKLGTYYIAHYQADAAEVAFVNAERLKPGDFRWPYYLGFVYQIVGKLERERESYKHALELRPGDIPARLHLAEVLLELGEDDEASRQFRRVLELNPAEAAAYGGLGRAASALGRHQEAIVNLTRALELQPRATIIHYQLALAYRRLGDVEAARAHLEQRGDKEIGFADPLLSAIEPLKRENIVEVVIEMASNPEEHDDRSLVLFSAAYLGDSPQAVGRIHQTVEMLTREPAGLDETEEDSARDRLVGARLHLAVAGLRLQQGDFGEARREVDAALALTPEMVEAILMLGYVLEQTGNLSEAIERYSIALALDPGNIRALRSRGGVNLNLRRNREAIEDLERLCALGLEGEGARIHLAVAYLRLGELETARGHYRKALDLNLDPLDEAQVHHHLGVIEARNGSLDRATEEYRMALALDPGLVAARLDLASAQAELGRYQEAYELYRQVIKVDPRNTRARRGEAEALTSMGRWQEAGRLLEEGWREMPESVELLHALARLLATADDPEVRNGERALDLAQRTLRAGTTPSRLETLAMASAEAGLFVDAVRLQRQAIRMMTWDGNLDALPKLEANLARYLAGQTCCATR
jgi:tetratricopeptide (TPR) repeat protein